MVNKKIGLGILAMVLVFGMAVTGCATKPVISGDGLYEIKVASFMGKKAATITQYLGTETNVTIPEQIDGITVQLIEAGAFEGKSLTGVVLPEGISSIGDRVFANNRLTSVSIPAGLKLISLATASYVGSTREGITRIGQSAFEGNQIESFTFSGEIDCVTFDSLGSLTPYYYANGKKPGIYTYSVEVTGGEDGEDDDGEGREAVGEKKWFFNGSALTELPAMIIISHPLQLQAIDGKTDILAATSIAHSIKRSKFGYTPFHIGHWIPAGEHTLHIGKMKGENRSALDFQEAEERVNFEPGIVYRFHFTEENGYVAETGKLEWEAQGPYSALTAEE